MEASSLIDEILYWLRAFEANRDCAISMFTQSHYRSLLSSNEREGEVNTRDKRSTLSNLLFIQNTLSFTVPELE